jgi:hypothetical protein
VTWRTPVTPRLQALSGGYTSLTAVFGRLRGIRMNQVRGTRIGFGAICTAILLVGLQASAYAVSAGPAFNATAGFAGYLSITGSASIRDSVTFKVPAITGCGKKDSVAVFGAFIAPLSSPTNLIAASGVDVLCPGGSATTPIYRAYLAAGRYGFGLPFTPRAGDYVTVSAAASASAGVTLTFKDWTQSANATVGSSQPAPSGLAALDGVVGAPTRTSPGWFPVPDFGSVIYTHGTIDGAPVPAGVFENMRDGQDVQIRTGPLFGPHNAWIETFKASI